MQFDVVVSNAEVGLKNAPIVSDIYTVVADVGVSRIFNGFQSDGSRLGRIAVGWVGRLSFQSDGRRIAVVWVG